MMSQKRVLIVEDEKDIRGLLDYNLKKQGYATEVAATGTEALNMSKGGKYDLILLDLMLPGMDGMELCRELKGNPETSGIPVIMLTARAEEIDKVLGLELGADDYVTKPFSPRELLARIKAVLRRTGEREKAAPGKQLKTGDIVIDTEKYIVKKGGATLDLSAIEFKLLLYMAERPGKVMGRDFLLDAVWGREAYVEPRTVDVHIRRLREKIEDDPSEPKLILTKRGVGYFFGSDGN